MPNFCSSCGSPITNPNAKFCSICSAPLVESNEQAPTLKPNEAALVSQYINNYQHAQSAPAVQPTQQAQPQVVNNDPTHLLQAYANVQNNQQTPAQPLYQNYPQQPAQQAPPVQAAQPVQPVQPVPVQQPQQVVQAAPAPAPAPIDNSGDNLFEEAPTPTPVPAAPANPFSQAPTENNPFKTNQSSATSNPFTTNTPTSVTPEPPAPASNPFKTSPAPTSSVPAEIATSEPPAPSEPKKSVSVSALLGKAPPKKAPPKIPDKFLSGLNADEVKSYDDRQNTKNKDEPEDNTLRHTASSRNHSNVQGRKAGTNKTQRRKSEAEMYLNKPKRLYDIEQELAVYDPDDPEYDGFYENVKPLDWEYYNRSKNSALADLNLKAVGMVGGCVAIIIVCILLCIKLFMG